MTQVRLMGSFDGWSRGVRLSCQGGDSVFRRFEGTLKARQVTCHRSISRCGAPVLTVYCLEGPQHNSAGCGQCGSSACAALPVCCAAH